MEVLQNWLAVYCYFTTTSLKISDCNRSFAFATTPGSSFVVKFWLSFLLRQSSSKIKQVDSVEFHEIIWVQVSRSMLQRKDVLTLLFGKLSKVYSQMMFVKRILLQTME
jgi:hypothetical protein